MAEKVKHHNFYETARIWYDSSNLRKQFRLGQYLIDQLLQSKTDSEIYDETDDDIAAMLFFIRYVDDFDDNIPCEDIW